MIVAGVGQPGAAAGFLVIGMSTKDQMELANGDQLFYKNINGSIALLKNVDLAAMVVMHAETEQDLMAAMRKHFDAAGLTNAEFEVIHNHGRQGEK